jgi:DNA invertase Pin-like site-specific DNA recombinase
MPVARMTDKRKTLTDSATLPTEFNDVLPVRHRWNEAPAEVLGDNIRVGYLRGGWDDSVVSQAVEALEAAGCTRVVVDSGPRRAGSSPALSSMVGRMSPGDIVVVVELDHLAGSLQQLIERLAELAGRGIEVETLSGEIGRIDPALGALIQAIHAFSQRTRRRSVLARPAGEPPAHMGRPRRLMDDDLARARQMIETAGRPIEDVARELGVSRATLYRNLRKS